MPTGSAEATGWAAAWETLASPAVRDAASAWGVVWAAVRRAGLGERLPNRYATDAWSAWRVHRRRDHPRGAQRRREHGDRPGAPTRPPPGGAAQEC